MSHVFIEGLQKHFEGKPPTAAVDDLSLLIEEGEFLVLLGPSGCGKTTTLRCLAGLETPSAGRITFGNDVVFDAAKRINRSPDKRNIGMVFQSYSLWPHLTVRKNIGYPLKARKITEGIAGGWVEETAALVDCTTLLDRYPSQLSGGQQQRVALARGLVARPDLVLFDEPLSNLDARLRDLVRAEIHELHARLGFTAVFVTHDQSEALALGDRLAIMRHGRIEQLASPEEVFERPANEYVAAFIGMPNRLLCERIDGEWRVCGERFVGAEPVCGESPGASAKRVAARLRADDLRVVPSGHGADIDGGVRGCAVPAIVVDSEFGGRHIDVALSVGSTRLHARVPAGEIGSFSRTLTPGQAVDVVFQPSAVRAFDADVEEILR